MTKSTIGHPKRKAKPGERLAYVQGVVLKFDGEECLFWPFSTDSGGYAHGCGNGSKGCVNKNHLRWATTKENMNDRVLHGTLARGETSGNSRLTESMVLQIRALKGKKSTAKIAEQFGIVQRSVYDIFNRRTWKHI